MIETSSAYISKIDEDTIKMVLKPNSRISTEEYRSFLPAYKEILGKDSDIKFLVIVQTGARVEKRMVDFLKTDFNTTYKKAEAYIIVSPISRMFMKVMNKLINNKYPIRHFEREENAIEWLKSIK
jgi:hypothetical protein